MSAMTPSVLNLSQTLLLLWDECPPNRLLIHEVKLTSRSYKFSMMNSEKYKASSSWPYFGGGLEADKTCGFYVWMQHLKKYSERFPPIVSIISMYVPCMLQIFHVFSCISQDFQWWAMRVCSQPEDKTAFLRGRNGLLVRHGKWLEEYHTIDWDKFYFSSSWLPVAVVIMVIFLCLIYGFLCFYSANFAANIEMQ